MKKWLYYLVLIVGAGVVFYFMDEAKEPSLQNAENSQQTTQNDGQHSTEKKDSNIKETASKTKNEDQADKLEIKLDASVFEGLKEEEIKDFVSYPGAKDIQVQKDGSVTYTIPVAEYKSGLNDMEKSLTSMQEELVKSADFPSIQNIEGNETYTKFKLTVDRPQYESGNDSLAIFSLVTAASNYQIFQGKSDYKIVIELINQDTNEVFNTLNYPEQ